jgi:hypothetical protein
MIDYVVASAALAILSVLSGTMVIAWCIITDEKYMDTWRDK